MSGILKRWRTVLRRTWNEYNDDQVSIVASGVAFRMVIAAFPGIALLVWVGTRMMGPGDAQALLKATSGLIPDASQSVLAQAVRSAMRDNPADNASQADTLGAAAPVLGLLFTLWNTNSGMKALFDALNVIHDIKERRSFVRFTAVTLLFTVGTLVTILSVMLLVFASPILLAAAGLSGPQSSDLAWLRWPVLFVIVAAALSLLYRYAPHHTQRPWPVVTFGGTLGSGLVVASSALFSWFTDRFGSLAVTYGSLSTIIAFMLWLWIVFWIVLTCAELDSCIADDMRDAGSRMGSGPP